MSAWNRRRFLETTALGLAALPAARAEASAASDEDPLGVRADFPITKELAYLNTASVGPLSRQTRDALAAYADEKMMYRDPGSRREAKASVRKKFAELFGATEEEIALLYSTSDGENIVVSAMDWKEGDNVVVDELHFTTSFVLFRELEERFGVELRVVTPKKGRVTIDDFDARVDERTRLLSVAWVSNRNGFRYDVRELSKLAHAHGAYLYADAIQALGHFPTDLHDEGVDFACGNGYKWLFADFGCSPFYVRAEHLGWMRPDRYGHSQVAKNLPDRRFALKTSAEKFEHANPAYGAVVAMDTALSYLEGVGLARVEKHVTGLAGELREGLSALGLELFTPPANASPIVSFYHGLDPDTLYDGLAAERVPVTFQEQGKLVRSAVALFNNKSDIDRLVGVLQKLV